MTPEQRLNTVKDNLKQIVGIHHVTRNYSDLDTEMDKHERIYAVLSSGFPQFGSLYDTEDEVHNFMIVAQQLVSENTTGEQKEAIEFSMLEVIKELVAQDGETNEPLNLELVSARTSRQMDPIHAWVLFELRFNDL
ncbi:hypothetical protein [Alteromonas sp. OM2203]|uniref:hypothetical protein n=1 Tax=Alteromonas sp. OM2203 TaxID=3398817 RepID=UPI003AF38521